MKSVFIKTKTHAVFFIFIRSPPSLTQSAADRPRCLSDSQMLSGGPEASYQTDTDSQGKADGNKNLINLRHGDEIHHTGQYIKT